MSKKSSFQPLAELLRPKSLEEVIGQTHLLDKNGPLYLSFKNNAPHSMILWGPSGVGKTTIARLAECYFKADCISLSAVFSGVKNIRLAIEQAQTNLKIHKHTILFIDEIHRFNKSQQDALLPFTESGLITLIGATTENPSFEINSALLSRCQVYVLKSLSNDELLQVFLKAKEIVLNDVHVDQDAIEFLLQHADGDARQLLNIIEIIHAACATNPISIIDKSWLHSFFSKTNRRFDKQGDCFYDQISALHKSVRGSHPDAALYWLCRMLDGGVDPHYLARRIIRMAWEDIGLADPRAIQIANDAASTYERLGSPEGDLALGQAVIYMAVAAKSNAGYKAFNQAKDFVKKDYSRSVPMHLRNAPTALMNNLGHGKGYRYAHDEPHAYAAGEHYLPDEMGDPGWYKPTTRGLENKILEKLLFLKSLDDDYKD